ncbi:MAG: serine/threonine-protein kinase [Myxococcales bacterium]|nr:serine/threonine protein kinase [Polyangiaceae bacterium]MDW8251615.1 serine/threonine-protein kinase [Myxococcales bacterium]
MNMTSQEDPDDLRPCPACQRVTRCQRPCAFCKTPVPARYIGAVISGKFRVEGLLGQGGMGAVYHAIHTDLQERVAIKFLRTSLATSAEARERFRREIVALVRLRHPGIVTILDAGEHEGAPFMVMELLQGQPLNTLVTQGTMLAPERVYHIIDQIFQVLDAAHRVGIVHRDLKPENVFLLEGRGQNDAIKLLDFGIAQVTFPSYDARLTQPGTVAGTPYYMSPEQCRNLTVGPPTDVYAATVMLFEMLTGELPFRANSAAEIMAQHLYVPPPKLSERGNRPAVPPGVEALVQRGLAKDPASRPSAIQFRQALAAAIRGTDLATTLQNLATSRPYHAALSREDRALTLPRQAPAVAQAPGVLRVLLWHTDPARAGTLQAVLGAGGLQTTCWIAYEPPPSEIEPPRVILLPAGTTAPGRLRQLRQHPALGGVPVLVFDLPRADEIPTYIRAGASDAVLYTAGDTEIPARALRIARRGR